MQPIITLLFAYILKHPKHKGEGQLRMLPDIDLGDEEAQCTSFQRCSNWLAVQFGLLYDNSLYGLPEHGGCSAEGCTGDAQILPVT